MTSLFSRLQKLNKEATPEPWRFCEPEDDGSWTVVRWRQSPIGKSAAVAVYDIKEQPDCPDADLIAECRNSLPAVLNLIEAAEKAETALGRVEALDPDGYDAWKELREAVAVFVSGQEEPT